MTFTFSGAVDGRPATARSTLASHVGPGAPKAARPGSEVVEQVGRPPGGRDCALGADGLADTGLVDASVVLRWAADAAAAHGFSDITIWADLTGLCPECLAGRATGVSVTAAPRR